MKYVAMSSLNAVCLLLWLMVISVEGQTLNVWLDSNYGVVDGNGTLEAPFLTLKQYSYWIAAYALPVSNVTLFVAPGIYIDPILQVLRYNTSLQPCERCPGPIYENSNIIFDFQSGNLFFHSLPSTNLRLSIQSIVFTGINSRERLTEPLFLVSSDFELNLDFVTIEHFILKSHIVHGIGGGVFYGNNVVVRNNTMMVVEETGYSDASGIFYAGDFDALLSIQNSIFENNTLYSNDIKSSNDGRLFQGAVIVSGGSVSVFASLFRNNGMNVDFDVNYLLSIAPEAMCGGVMALYGPSNKIEASQFENNFISFNWTNINTTRGGSICIGQKSSLYISSSSFSSNTAGSGAAIASASPNRLKLEWSSPESDITIISSIFTRNICALRGCAISLSTSLIPTVISISKSTFSDNDLVSNYKCVTKTDSFQSNYSFIGPSIHLLSILAQINNPSQNPKKNASFVLPYLQNAASSHGINQLESNNRLKTQRKGQIHSQARVFGKRDLSRLDGINSPITPLGTSNFFLGGMAIAVIGQQQYFAAPANSHLILMDVDFVHNMFSTACSSTLNQPFADGASILLNQVALVMMKNVTFGYHFISDVSSIVSMRKVSSIVAHDVAFIGNTLVGGERERRKIALWDIQNQGFAPSVDENILLRMIRSWTRKERLSGMIEEITQMAMQVPPNVYYSFRNLIFESNTARDAFLYCSGAHSIHMADNRWENQISSKGQLVTFTTAFVSIRSISSSVTIEDSILNRVEMPIEISYVSLETILKNCLFSHFSGSQPAFLSLHQSSSVSLQSCNFTSNEVTAVSITSSKTVQISDSIFFNNSSPAYAGALRFTQSPASLFQLEFNSNSGLHGGAIATDSMLFIVKSTFLNNSALQSGGAIDSISSLAISLEDVNCNDNTAGTRGGCLSVRSDQSSASPEFSSQVSSPHNDESPNTRLNDPPIRPRTEIILLRNLFSGNRASTGGAISLLGGVTSTIDSTSFLRNNATEQAGAIELWTNFMKDSISTPTPFPSAEASHRIMNCEFIDNHVGSVEGLELTQQSHGQNRPLPLGSVLPSYLGGAILAHHIKLVLTGCNFAENSAEGHGGAIYAVNVLRTGISIHNATFTRNWAEISGGALSIAGQPIEPLLSDDEYCDLSLWNVFFESNFALYGGAFSWSPSSNCANNQLHTPDSYLSNVTFARNGAFESGGAVFSVFATNSQFYSYANLSMDSNTANVSGNNFFYHHVPLNDLPTSEQVIPPNFCDPGLCSLTNASFSRRQTWGPNFASSFWRMDYDLMPLKGINTVQSFGVPYRIFDLYHQEVVQPLIMSANIMPWNPETPSPSAKRASFSESPSNMESGLIFNGFTNSEMKLTPGVGGQYARDPFVLFSRNSTNPFVAPVNVTVLVQLIPGSYTQDHYAFNGKIVAFHTQVYRCPEGFGLWKLPGSESLFSCLPCPIGTYNFNGDGQCYSCHGESLELSCQGDSVTALTGFWTFKPQITSNTPTSYQNTSEHIRDTITNELFVAKCRPGFCLTGKCEIGRNGVMCGSCDDGAWETLFSRCTDHLCHNPAIGFIIIGILVGFTAIFGFHYFVNRVPVITMHLSFTITIGILLLQSSLDWSLPQATPKLSSFLCGFRANEIDRVLIFSFMPYSAIGMLMVVWSVVQGPERLFKISQKFVWFAVVSNEVSWLRIMKSIYGILIILSVPSMKYALMWIQCTKTPFWGNRWIFAPSILCSSPPFLSSRLLSLLILLPFSILPIIMACISIFIGLWNPTKDEKIGFLSPIPQLLFHPLSRTLQRLTSIIDLLGKIIIAIILAVMVEEEKIRSIIISGILIILMIANGLGSPFWTSLQRISGTLSYGVLAVLAVAEPSSFSLPIYPIISLSLFLTWILISIIVFTISHRIEAANTTTALHHTDFQPAHLDASHEDQTGILQ